MQIIVLTLPAPAGPMIRTPNLDIVLVILVSW
jgi:hypothetical protein